MYIYFTYCILLSYLQVFYLISASNVPPVNFHWMPSSPPPSPEKAIHSKVQMAWGECVMGNGTCKKGSSDVVISTPRVKRNEDLKDFFEDTTLMIWIFCRLIALACCHLWKTGTHGLGSRAACFPLESNETRINTEPTEYHWPLSDGGRGKGVPLQIGSAGACFFFYNSQ